MKKNKKTLIALLCAALFLFTLSACADTPEPANVEPDPPEIEDTDPPEYETPISLPETLDPEDLDDPDDWYIPHYDIVVNGVGLPGVSAIIVGEDEIWATHVPLVAVLEALDLADSAQVSWNHETGEVTMEGLYGPISFTLGADGFTVNDQTIPLFHHAVEYERDNNIYVPTLFFRDVFGLGSAYSQSGQIFINSDGGDMH